MADIKQIQVGTITYDLVDTWARQRIEGIAQIYPINANVQYTATTYTDWDTEETVTISDVKNIWNKRFDSDTKDLVLTEVSGTWTSPAYIVLTMTDSSGKNYIKKLSSDDTHEGMQIGDTIYIAGSDLTPSAPDRWLSAWAESPLSGTFTALESKIDLTEYAKKTEAAKPGTYTTVSQSTTTTSSAGAQTATGQATISYDKADNVTGSASGSTLSTTGWATSVTIEGSSFTFTGTTATISGSTKYTPAGSVTFTIDQHEYKPEGTIGGSVTIAAHSHDVTLSTTQLNYISTLSSTVIKAGSHSHTVDTHQHAADVTALTSITYNTQSDVWYGTPSKTTATAVASVSKTDFSKVMYAPTVNSDGVLSWSTAALSYVSGISTLTVVSDFTKPSTVTLLSGVKSVSTATVAGQPSAVTLTSSSAGEHTHSLSMSTASAVVATGVSIKTAGAHTVYGSSFSFTGTTKTMGHNIQNVSFTGTEANISISASYQPQGSLSGTQTVPQHQHTYYQPVDHTHSIGSTSTSVTGSASVAVGNHTHEYSHTHSITIPAITS